VTFFERHQAAYSGHLGVNTSRFRTRLPPPIGALRSERSSQSPPKVEDARRPNGSILAWLGAILRTVGALATVEVETALYCSSCNAAKCLLRRIGGAFTEVDIGDNREKGDEMIKWAQSHLTWPWIFVDKLRLGRFDQLQVLERERRLNIVLRGEAALAGEFPRISA
jgi:glutaredoxin 3